MKNYNLEVAGGNSGFYTTTSRYGFAESAEPIAENEDTGGETLTREEIAQIIAQSLSALRVYVVESDITQAQNSVRAIVEQSIL